MNALFCLFVFLHVLTPKIVLAAMISFASVIIVLIVGFLDIDAEQLERRTDSVDENNVSDFSNETQEVSSSNVSHEEAQEVSSEQEHNFPVLQKIFDLSNKVEVRLNLKALHVLINFYHCLLLNAVIFYSDFKEGAHCSSR